MVKNFIFIFIFIFAFAFAGAPVTKIHFVEPYYQGEIKAKYKIVKSVEGSCYSSIANPRDNAWRCMDLDHKTYDPCFSQNKNRNILVCLTSPWNKSAVEFKTELPYIRVNKSGKPVDYQPWGIILSNGVQCQQMNGASTQVGHERVSFTCDKGTYITGDIHREAKVWVVKWQHGYFSDWMNVSGVYY